MKKKILLISAAVIVLAAVCVIGYTLAYFTATDNQDNTFTVGNVKIDLTEPIWDENLTIEPDPVFNPGVAVAKDPMVTNTGANEAYVRIEIKLDEDFYNFLFDNDIDLMDIIGTYDTTTKTFTPGVLDGWTPDPLYTTVNRWIFNYDTTLAGSVEGQADDFTEKLFTDVMLPNWLTSDDFENFTPVNVKIMIVAQAIQADGFYGDAAAAFAALENPPVKP